MTYGWALLIVLTSLGAFSYYIGLDRSADVPSSCNLGYEFGCGSYVGTEQGLLVFEIENLVGETIKLNYVEFIFEDGKKEVVRYENCGSDSPIGTIGAGSKKAIRLFNDDGEITFRKYKEKIDVRIHYTPFREEALPKFSDGTIIFSVLEDVDIDDYLDEEIIFPSWKTWKIYDAEGDVISDRSNGGVSIC